MATAKNTKSKATETNKEQAVEKVAVKSQGNQALEILQRGIQDPVH